MSDDSTTTTDTGGAYTEAINRSLETKAEESQQLQGQVFREARGGAVNPPFSPVRLAKLIELNTTHAKCGFSKARNVAGYGLEIVPHPEVDEPDESQRDVAEDFWFGPESTWQVGPLEREQATPADVLEMAWADYEFIGWLSLEALVNPITGEPTGLAYIPAPSIRKRKNDPGFVQLKDGELRYFGAFGDRYGDDRVFVDADSGDFGSGVEGAVANEIIWKRNHTPFVDHYGTPDIIPATANIQGDQRAREYNIDYFDNDGVPKLAIIVEGGTLSQDSRTDLYNLFHEKLPESNHRSAILEVEELINESPGEWVDPDGSQQRPRIRIEPLAVGLEEDAAFLGYHDYNEHEILKAHEVPPIEAGVIESGAFSTDAEAQRRSYLETTIGPKQESFAQLLHETVHWALGVTDYTIRFKQRGVDTRLTDAQVARERIQASQGMLTVNELRSELGYEPLDGSVGEMLVAEVGGMGAPGGMGAGNIESMIRDVVESQFDELADELETQQSIDARIARGMEADD